MSELKNSGVNVHLIGAAQDTRGMDAKKAFAVGLEFAKTL